MPVLIGINVPILRKSSSDDTSFFVKTDVRPARKHPTGKDVLSCEHGSGKATIPVKVQRQTQIFAAGAGNAIDIEIARQVKQADAPVGMEPHQSSAKTRQAIKLLIRAQFHIVESSILASSVVTETGVFGEPPRAEDPLASQ